LSNFWKSRFTCVRLPGTLYSPSKFNPCSSINCTHFSRNNGIRFVSLCAKSIKDSWETQNVDVFPASLVCFIFSCFFFCFSFSFSACFLIFSSFCLNFSNFLSSFAFCLSLFLLNLSSFLDLFNVSWKAT
jgi:hypothetical protein